jgi:hypothetical protein
MIFNATCAIAVMIKLWASHKLSKMMSHSNYIIACKTPTEADP